LEVEFFSRLCDATLKYCGYFNDGKVIIKQDSPEREFFVGDDAHKIVDSTEENHNQDVMDNAHSFQERIRI